MADLSKWSDFHKTRTLLFAKKPLVRPGAPIFTMGSCFAGEIRNALKLRGHPLYPDYPGIAFDRAKAMIDMLPEDKLMEHYDTFAMRQEFERAFGLWTDAVAGAWEVRSSGMNDWLKADLIWQEPSRRRVFASSLAALEEASAQITEAVRVGIDSAELIVLTLGLTEAWRHNKTGRYLCCAPDSTRGTGIGKATFHRSGFAENHANVKAILDMLLERYPSKQVLLTVSPVPLNKTYSGMDVGTANLESKSILRAVAGQITREYANNVTYFPAYEMATIIGIPVYQEDGRHVLPSFADLVVATFTAAHIA